MPKENYKQKVRDVWLRAAEFKAWLRKDPTDATRAYCSYCKCTITAKLSDLHAHGATKKHAASMEGHLQQNKIPFLVELPSRTIEQEAALCLFVAQHCAITSVDHLSNICIKKFDDSSSASKIKLHRTKCTYIIKNALAPHFKDELYKDIGGSRYSLLLDESTDISVTKLLGAA
ncbi:uncharacterized protein LOC124461155 [Drosophila willistoni]|uniref:uncharacterized protein LOC124461155 n=1 Tax=Drosophila willistoni TaxID=7260 RepID=UPI001F083FF2|nr:uncharacterized protein LOC124461155 [Drosophila willistoni]